MDIEVVADTVFFTDYPVFESICGVKATLAIAVAAGEVLQWHLPQSAKVGAGTLLLSDKPVALHAGTRFLRLQPAPGPGGESAHQQNLAVSALGVEYVAAPYETRRKDLAPEDVEYRFVGVVDGAELSYDPPVPGAPATLAKWQVVDISTKLTFRVRGQDGDHPFAMAQLMDTANLPGGSRSGATAPGFGPALGDEEFVIVLPPAQFLQRYAFFTDPTYATTNLVVTRMKGDKEFKPVTVDCLGELGGWKPVGEDGLFEVTTADLVRADIGVNGCKNGHHIAESDGPFGMVVWGPDSYSSYAYPAGGSARALNEPGRRAHVHTVAEQDLDLAVVVDVGDDRILERRAAVVRLVLELHRAVVAAGRSEGGQRFS